jgi:ABC-type uncharacterized transport system substrate-binding protein
MEVVSRFKLIIDPKTANALGIQIPRTLLARTTETTQ